MKPLKNARHESFAQHLARGVSQAEAYVQGGYKDTPSARANAVRLIAKESVSARVEYLKDKAAEQAIVTTADVLRGLRDEAELYGDGASHSARVSAWAHLGKHLSMFTDKQELTIKRDPREMSTDELEEYLRVRGLLE